MNCLVVMPQVCSKIGDKYRFPLGICYISAMLKQRKNCSVTTLNLNHFNGSLYDILNSKIKEANIEVVLVGGLITSYNKIKEIVDTVKDINPHIVTIVGGGVITGAPEVVMQGMNNADIGIIAEGEYTVCEIIDIIQAREDLAQVCGILYRKDGQVVKTQKRNDIANLNVLPWPDYDGFEMEYYLEHGLGDFGVANFQRTFAIITSRSCPFQCTFCFHSCGQTYRQRSLEDVFAEIDYVIEKYKAEYLVIFDELFTVDVNRVRQFCSQITKRSIPWECQLRVDSITEEMLQLFKQSGCASVSFGIESMDDRILKSMRKKITTEQVNHAISLAEKVGIPCGGNLIFGDIEETLETAMNSLKWYEKVKYPKIELILILVYPGSYLYKYALEKGLIKNQLEYIENGCLHINVSKITEEEFPILVNKIREYREEQTISLSNKHIVCIDKEKCRVTVNLTCPQCKNEFIQKDADMLAEKSPKTCPHCFKNFILETSDLFRETFEKNIQQLANIEGDICIWGNRDFLGNLIKDSSVQTNENIFIIDKSPLKRKSPLCGKQVFEPEILNNKKFTFLIVTCIDFIEEIRNEVRKKYPHIKEVVSIYEFILQNEVDANGIINKNR